MHCNVQRKKIEFKNKVIFIFYNISFDGCRFLGKKNTILLQKMQFTSGNFYLLF